MTNNELEIATDRLKKTAISQDKEIDLLKERCVNLETWADEIIKWIQEGADSMEQEQKGLTSVINFLKSWSKK